MYQKILTASDASEGALKSVRVAAEIAKADCAALIVVHAYNPPAIIPTMMAAGDVNGLACIDPSLLDTWNDGARRAVRMHTETALANAGIAYRYIERDGHPAQTIVDIAAEEEADLIVVGSRGLTGIKTLLLGSVSERVAHLAHCSVLIVR